MMPSSDMFGPATLAVTQGIAAFHSFLPPFTEIRRTTPEDNAAFAADVRMGEVAAVTTTMGLGLIVSSLTGNPLPVYTSAVMCLILVCLYETTLRSKQPLEVKPTLTLVKGSNDA